jgi:hypothetical protein
MTADTTMTSANTYYDAVVVSVSAGSYLVWGNAQFTASHSNGGWQARITDGTTVFADASSYNVSGLPAGQTSVFAYVVMASTGDIHLQCAHNGGLNDTIIATLNNNGTTHKCTCLMIAQIA